MRQIVRPALEWRVLRNLGASLVVAGASVGMWGALSLTSIAVGSTSANAAPADNVTLCHSTNAPGNPYVSITVAEDSTQLAAHEADTGPIWFPGITVTWGDIIPSESAAESNGTAVVGLNDTAAGLAILANGCNLVTTTTTSSGSTSTGSTSTATTSTDTGTGGTSAASTSSTSTGTGATSAVTTATGSGAAGAATGSGVAGAATGSGAAGAAAALPKAGAHMTAPDGTPIGIGIGLAVAGLSMLGIGYRRREIAP